MGRQIMHGEHAFGLGLDEACLLETVRIARGIKAAYWPFGKCL